MPALPFSFLHGQELPKKLVRLVTLMALGFAMLMAGAPWLVERLVHSRIDRELQAQAATYAQALEGHLESTELALQREVERLGKPLTVDLNAMVKQWLANYPDAVMVRLHDPTGEVQQTWMRDSAIESASGTVKTQSLLPLQLLALQRAEETRQPMRSAIYPMGNRTVTDLYLPARYKEQPVLAVTFDTRLWESKVLDKELSEKLVVDVIAYSTSSAIEDGHLVNDSSWEGLWSLHFRSKNTTLSTLQVLQPLFLAIAVLFCAVTYLALRNLGRRIQAEEALRKKSSWLDQQTRLTTLAEMSAGIAHEINQPLAAIANFSASARLMLRSGKTTSDIEPLLERIEEQSQRAARVIKAVRALIHNEPIRENTLDLGLLLNNLHPHLELLTRADNIALSIQTEPALLIRADATLIEQVFLNLVRNSVQALARIHSKNGRIGIAAFVSDSRVCVRVEDNGPGIDKKNVLRIFDSFFSTGSDGLGIGLSLCRSVLERLQGRIELERNSSEGVSFLITIPQAS